MKVELTKEAMNCLRFWKGHEMYGGSFSDIILKQMEEWLNRDMPHSATPEEIEVEFNRIKKGR